MKLSTLPAAFLPGLAMFVLTTGMSITLQSTPVNAEHPQFRRRVASADTSFGIDDADIAEDNQRALQVKSLSLSMPVDIEHLAGGDIAGVSKGSSAKAEKMMMDAKSAKAKSGKAKSSKCKSAKAKTDKEKGIVAPIAFSMSIDFATKGASAKAEKMMDAKSGKREKGGDAKAGKESSEKGAKSKVSAKGRSDSSEKAASEKAASGKGGDMSMKSKTSKEAVMENKGEKGASKKSVEKVADAKAEKMMFDAKSSKMMVPDAVADRMSMPDGLLNGAISKGSSAKAEKEGMKSSKSAKLFKEPSAKTGKEKAFSMHHEKATPMKEDAHKKEAAPKKKAAAKDAKGAKAEKMMVHAKAVKMVSETADSMSMVTVSSEGVAIEQPIVSVHLDNENVVQLLHDLVEDGLISGHMDLNDAINALSDGGDAEGEIVRKLKALRDNGRASSPSTEDNQRALQVKSLSLSMPVDIEDLAGGGIAGASNGSSAKAEKMMMDSKSGKAQK